MILYLEHRLFVSIDPLCCIWYVVLMDGMEFIVVDVIFRTSISGAERQALLTSCHGEMIDLSNLVLLGMT